MRYLGYLMITGLFVGTSAIATENQPTTNRLQQQAPDATTTNSLNKPGGQQTTTGLAAHSRKQPTLNNLQAPPQPAPPTPSQR